MLTSDVLALCIVTEIIKLPKRICITLTSSLTRGGEKMLTFTKCHYKHLSKMPRIIIYIPELSFQSLRSLTKVFLLSKSIYLFIKNLAFGEQKILQLAYNTVCMKTVSRYTYIENFF